MSMFMVKRMTRTSYDGTSKNPNIVYFVGEGTTLANSTRFSIYMGDRPIAEEIDLDGYATETFVSNAIASHNSSGSAHTDIRGLITTLTNNLGALQTIVEALEGAYVYQGTITTSGAHPTPTQLNNRINALLSRAPRMGDVLVTEDSNTDYDKHEWYYNGTIWNDLGAFIIAQATASVEGIVKLSSASTIGQLDGINVITENVLKNIVNNQLLRRNIDDYVKTVNSLSGDIILHGLNILLDGVGAVNELKASTVGAYSNASTKVDLPYGTNIDPEEYSGGTVIRIRSNSPAPAWVNNSSNGAAMWTANPSAQLADIEYEGMGFAGIASHMLSNFPAASNPVGSMGRGYDTQFESYFYALLQEPTAQYQYYEVVVVGGSPDPRTVTGAIYEAEGRIENIEMALNWDND